MPQFDDKKQKEQYDEIRHREGEDLAQLLADRYGLSYIDMGPVLINSSTIKIIPEELSRKAMMVLYDLTLKHLKIAILTPNNEFLEQVLADLAQQGYTYELAITSADGLALAWGVYKEVSYAIAEEAGVITIPPDILTQYINQVKSMHDVTHMLEKVYQTESGSHGTSKIIELVMGGAIAIGASDVHFEPEEGDVRLRYRLDGILQDIYHFTSENFPRILSRIKLLAGVKLNVTKEAQDGRYTIRLNDISIEIRTSILPSAYQESIVMRILNPKSIGVPMEELGMDDVLFAIMQREINKPNGLILTTGPTGSGKTTTLYSFLKKLRDPSMKIITIEDPIEYHLEGISQTQTNAEKGYTFHNGLRAAVRQDPDVIMVGEIRDGDTAAVAIDSALTGHIVFSTLHTNNAAGAIPRLIDLGVNPKIISSALNITLAQRLVRKLCVFCKEQYIPEGKYKEAYERITKEIQEKRTGVVAPPYLYRPKGCDKCSLTGYKGRLSIYEGILMDIHVEAVLREGNPSEREIREAARPQGIFTMQQDGVMKCITGITSIEEVESIAGLEELR